MRRYGNADNNDHDDNGVASRPRSEAEEAEDERDEKGRDEVEVVDDAENIPRLVSAGNERENDIRIGEDVKT